MLDSLPSFSGIVFNYLASPAKNLIAGGTYGLSNMFFSSGVELATYPVYLTHEFANSNCNLYKNNITPLFKHGSSLLTSLHELATKTLAPQAYEFAKKNIDPNITTFQASNFIPPALLLALSYQKVAANASNAHKKFKALLSAERSITTYYEMPASNDLNYNLKVSDHRNLSTGSLLVGAGLDSLWTAGWLLTGQLTRQGMIDELVRAGNLESEATHTVNALILTGISLPIIWQAFKHLAKPLTEQKKVVENDKNIVEIDGHSYIIDIPDPLKLNNNIDTVPFWDPSTQSWNQELDQQ